jgi:alpha-tubulin suppressor-like RCC1 family protein
MRWALVLTLLAGCERMLGLQELGTGDGDPIPPPGSWFMVASGGDHSCAIRSSDFSLWCWGSNSGGALGLGVDVAQKGAPELVSSAMWSVVSTHSSASSYLVTPGQSGSGGGGGGGTTNGTGGAPRPPTPPGIGGAGTASSTLGEVTCGIQNDGSLWCWGANANGMVGNGMTLDQYVPMQIAPGQIWTAVSVGGRHVCAIDGDAVMWCWGDGSSGQLGTGISTQQLVPTRVSSTAAWTAVTTGDSFTCGLDSNSIAWCWGQGGYGQIGNGQWGTEYLPSQVDDETWTAIAAGSNHVCAIRTDGHLRCWGDNAAGELGNGESYSTFSPIELDDDTDGWIAVTAGAAYSCATRNDGHLLCWGDNSNGELGNTAISRFDSSPTVVNHGAVTWTQISAGRDHTCGIGADHNLWCFGLAELGAGTDVHEPTQLEGKWNAVSAGQSSTCAIDSSGALACWGENGNGQLGDSTTTRRTSPKTIAGPSWASVSVGVQSACAIDHAGTMYCWGTSTAGLGDGSIGRLTPTAIPGGPWTMVATDTDHTCAIDASRALYCWGNNNYSELGTGDAIQYPMPHLISGGWDSVTTGGTPWEAHTCAVSGTEVSCWGANYSYQVDSTGMPVTTPMPVTASVQVAAGQDYSCTIDGNGSAWCWGANANGQLGNGQTNVYMTTPTPVTGAGPWLSLASGYTHTCAIATDHSLWCWGDDTRGQLGDGYSTTQPAPIHIGTGTTWKQVVAGGTHTCALDSGGGLWCWGDNTSGQLGLGTASEGTPVRVP